MCMQRYRLECIFVTCMHVLCIDTCVCVNSIRQIKELYEAEQTDGRLTRESLAETQRQLEASTHDKELLLSQSVLFLFC